MCPSFNLYSKNTNASLHQSSIQHSSLDPHSSQPEILKISFHNKAEGFSNETLSNILPSILNRTINKDIKQPPPTTTNFMQEQHINRFQTKTSFFKYDGDGGGEPSVPQESFVNLRIGPPPAAAINLMNSTLGLDQQQKPVMNSTTLKIKPNQIFNRPKEQQSDRGSMPEFSSPDKYHHIIGSSGKEEPEDKSKFKQPGIRIAMSCPKPSEKQLPNLEYQSGSTLRGVGSSIFNDIQRERKNQNRSEMKQHQKLTNSPLNHREST